MSQLIIDQKLVQSNLPLTAYYCIERLASCLTLTIAERAERHRRATYLVLFSSQHRGSVPSIQNISMLIYTRVRVVLSLV